MNVVYNEVLTKIRFVILNYNYSFKFQIELIIRECLLDQTKA